MTGETQNSKLKTQNFRIIGVGNEFRGDDAAGLYVARQLRCVLPAVRILEASGEGAALMQQWQNATTVILIDAVLSGVTAGTIHRLEAHVQSVPTSFFRYSTHAFGVAEAIELARVLGSLPERLIVYGIEGQDFALGAPLSPVVAQACDAVVMQVHEESQNFEC